MISLINRFLSISTRQESTFQTKPTQKGKICYQDGKDNTKITLIKVLQYLLRFSVEMEPEEGKIKIP